MITKLRQNLVVLSLMMSASLFTAPVCHGFEYKDLKLKVGTWPIEDNPPLLVLGKDRVCDFTDIYCMLHNGAKPEHRYEYGYFLPEETAWPSSMGIKSASQVNGRVRGYGYLHTDLASLVEDSSFEISIPVRFDYRSHADAAQRNKILSQAILTLSLLTWDAQNSNFIPASEESFNIGYFHEGSGNASSASEADLSFDFEGIIHTKVYKLKAHQQFAISVRWDARQLFNDTSHFVLGDQIRLTSVE